MRRTHHGGHRPGRESKRAGAGGKQRSGAARKQPPSYLHPLFGDIPLLPITQTDASGREHRSLDYDPDYTPPLPDGAVRGNVRNQEFCRICHVPRYFYVDIPRTCEQCEKEFVFGAAEQKYWYETLKFHFDSTATRCATCRKQRRNERALERALEAARHAARSAPKIAENQLALAEALARLFRQTGRGSLAEIVAAARRARGLLEGHAGEQIFRSQFWEATGHALAGRKTRARAEFTRLSNQKPSGRRARLLAREVRDWLAALES